MLERILIYGAIFAGIWFHGWWTGNSGKRELQAEIQASQEKRRADITDLVLTFTTRAQQRYEEHRLEDQRNQLQIASLKAKVHSYVSPKVDAAVVIPRGFVLLHDAAWRRTPLPEPAQVGGSLEAPSGIPLSRVAEVSIDNADACIAIRVEAERWRQWYADVSSSWGAFARGAQGQPQAVPQGPVAPAAAGPPAVPDSPAAPSTSTGDSP